MMKDSVVPLRSPGSRRSRRGVQADDGGHDPKDSSPSGSIVDIHGVALDLPEKTTTEKIAGLLERFTPGLWFQGLGLMV